MRLAPLYAVFAVTSISLLGCSGGDPATEKDGGAVADSGAPPNEIRFDTASYTLKPGEEKRYMCFTSRLPAGKSAVINEIAPIYGKATHHLTVYYTISDEPNGAFDCPELTRENWIPLYGGGVESGTLKTPPGTGFHLNAGQQILVQLHLLNAGNTELTDKATIVLKTTDDQSATPTGIFGFDNRQIQIPAHSSGVVQTMDCPNVGLDMDVFAVFGHMHQHGKHIDVSRGAQPGEEMLFEEDWNFDNQPTVPKSFHVNQTDNVHVRCSYDNNGNADLAYGESTANEMCSFVFYYSPYKSLNGCLKSP